MSDRPADNSEFGQREDVVAGMVALLLPSVLTELVRLEQQQGGKPEPAGAED